MNETIQTILRRRSCRAYRPDPIKQDDLDTIMECALSAPSAMNTQNWHFTVIHNQELIGRMNAEIRGALPAAATERMTARNGGDPDFSVFYFAPTVVMVSGEAEERYAPMNASFATQNLCLAAESLGIASCIIGFATFLLRSPKAGEYFRELGIPDGYSPLYAVILGYPGMEMAKPERIPGKVNVIR